MKAPEQMTHTERLKTARAWAREKGGVLRRQCSTINGAPAYGVQDPAGEWLCENWTLYSIACEVVYA